MLSKVNEMNGVDFRVTFQQSFEAKFIPLNRTIRPNQEFIMVSQHETFRKLLFVFIQDANFSDMGKTHGTFPTVYYSLDNSGWFVLLTKLDNEGT